MIAHGGRGPARPTVVKVCGITRGEDATWALRCGADWLGFIVRGESPRLIAPEQAAAIVDAARVAVPERAWSAVAVMVGATPEVALELARRAHAERVQLHGVSAASWPRDFPLPCAFAVGVTTDGALAGEEPPQGHLLMLDTAVAGRSGGSGEAWPWSAARAIVSRRDVLLAGGLSGENVADAVRLLHPFGVDASSRLESRPGAKDPERVRRFVEAVRACEAGAEQAR